MHSVQLLGTNVVALISSTTAGPDNLAPVGNCSRV